MRSVFGIICAFSLLLQSASFSLRAVPRFLSLTTSRSGASHGHASHYLQASAQDDDVRVEQAAIEEMFREYPYKNKSLPVLPDCNNYYSGKCGDSFWHQNADQVLLYIPVDDHVSKKDIAAKIEVKRVSIKIKDMDAIEFDCPERIIPDGSFWTFEEDDDQKYIQLDMEKRFRMINWKGLFSQHDDLPPISNEQNSMLDQLYAANKGISELTGASPESIEDMMGNPDLYSMMNGDINTSPTIVDDDGTQLGMGSSEAEEDLERAFRETIEETVSRDDIGDDDEDAGDGGNDFIDVEEVK